MIRLIEGPTKIRLVGDDIEIRAIANRLRVHPKGYEHSPSYKAFQLTNGEDGWDGYISPVRITDYGQAECLRGHRDVIIKLARSKDKQVNTEECLRSPFESLVSDDIPDDIIAADFDLDAHQREALTYWLNHGMGVNKIAVNGGKTAMFAAAAAMIKRKFPAARILYVTQSERLVRQGAKDIKGFLPGWDITQYGGSKKDNTGADMVIATVAMLWSNRKTLIDSKWFMTFMAVLYDESHHAAADSSTQLLLKMPCYFRFGASDSTGADDPARAHKIQGLLGPIRYVVPVSVNIDIGRSAKPSIYLVENTDWWNRHKSLPHQADPNTPAWAFIQGEWKRGVYLGPVFERDDKGEIVLRKVRELEGAEDQERVDANGVTETVQKAKWVYVEKPVVVDGYHTIQFDGEEGACDVDSRFCILQRVIDKAVTSFKDRNALIVAWAKYFSVKKDFPTLVVCTRTMHVLILETLLKVAVGDDKVRVLFSDHTPKQRDEAFDWFKKTRGSVLVSPLVKEGVSINEIRGGIVADYMSSWESANQVIGRFIRKKKDKANEAHIVFFVDVQHPSLRKGGRAMFKRLYDVRGYKFYYPVIGPDTIEGCPSYEKL